MSYHRFALLSLFFPMISIAAETAPSSAESRPAMPPEVRAFLDASLKQYRAAKSYHDQYLQEIKTEGSGTEQLRSSESHHEELTFASPNKIALKTNEFKIICDGNKIWERVVPLEQYAERAAPDHVDLSALAVSRFSGVEDNLHPLAAVLTNPAGSLEDAFGDVKEYKGLKEETRQGKPGKAVTGTIATKSFGGSTVPFSAWFNAKNILEEITLDFTKPVQQQLHERGGEQMGIHLTRFVQSKRFVDPLLDGKLPADAFTFQKGEYDQKVDGPFEPMTREQLQQRLIGRPAPAFTTTDLQGKEVKLSDLKGKVVLLDFWATTCGPCIMAMPYMQKLSEKYAKQPVAIVGVNSDSIPPATQPAAGVASRLRPIAEFVKNKKLTYLQLADIEGDIAGDYRVGAIPCIFVLDKNGVTRAVHLGFSPAIEQRFATEIDLLLKGKPLPSQPAEE